MAGAVSHDGAWRYRRGRSSIRRRRRIAKRAAHGSIRRSPSTSITGRLRTGGRSPSCWKSAVCRIRCMASTSAQASSSSRPFSPSRPTTACRRSSIRTDPTASRFRCSSRARSCSISPTRRAASAARRRASEWRSASGCSGRWAVSGRWPARPIISASTPSEKIPYAIDRYTDEVNRLFGVMNRRLADHEYLAGPYSIADMACVGWTRGWKRYGQEIADFPHLARWLDAVARAAGGSARARARHPRPQAARPLQGRRGAQDPVRPARPIDFEACRRRAALAMGGGVGHISAAPCAAGDVAERLKAAVC